MFFAQKQKSEKKATKTLSGQFLHEKTLSETHNFVQKRPQQKSEEKKQKLRS